MSDATQRIESIEKLVMTHDRAIFGDRENPAGHPGVIAEQRRTNEILSGIQDNFKWLIRLVIAGFVTQLGLLAYNGTNKQSASPQPAPVGHTAPAKP